jgi:flagellar L-ring protein precursor FlgH
MKLLTWLLIFSSILPLSGCASIGQTWRNLIGSNEPQPTSVKSESGKLEDLKYSDQADVPVLENKRYRRMTRDQFEKEGLTDDTGSLWSGDGQGSYLFSANMVRVPGDSVNIILDGEAKKQLGQKAAVLAQLMKKAARALATVPGNPPAPGSADSTATPAAGGTAVAEKDKADREKKEEKKDEKDDEGKDAFSVANIPARIVERVTDGSYRVRGSQTVMIGKEEFRVIASGLVKSVDIGDEGVASSKMMEPKFDIVSMKRKSEKMTEIR